ncbi:MAG: leucine-rich repeat domain-containing protein [Clostridia bacterium]|nr:leucine-rich repeat domain-containing protein [Clostridia bacterium]
MRQKVLEFMFLILSAVLLLLSCAKQIGERADPSASEYHETEAADSVVWESERQTVSSEWEIEIETEREAATDEGGVTNTELEPDTEIETNSEPETGGRTEIDTEAEMDAETETDGEMESEPVCDTHSFGDWEIIQSPGCAEIGWKERACKICTTREWLEIAALGHEFSTSLSYDGRTHWYGTLCGHGEVRGNEELHAFGNWTVLDSPGCGTEGSKTRQCGLCFMTQEVSIPATGHHLLLDKNLMCQACQLPYKDIGLIFERQEDGYRIAGYTGREASVFIPAQYGGFPVVAIEAEAFAGHRELEEIYIPVTVAEIGANAFWDCAGLQAVYGGSTAAWCAISFENYLSNPLYYSHKLFLNGEEITSLVIPSGVTSIGNYAFAYCDMIRAVTFSSDIQSIGDSAFYYCSSLDSVVYGGSGSHWQRVIFGDSWNSYTGDYVVECLNGRFPK